MFNINQDGVNTVSCGAQVFPPASSSLDITTQFLRYMLFGTVANNNRNTLRNSTITASTSTSHIAVTTEKTFPGMSCCFMMALESVLNDYYFYNDGKTNRIDLYGARSSQDLIKWQPLAEQLWVFMEKQTGVYSSLDSFEERKLEEDAFEPHYSNDAVHSFDVTKKHSSNIDNKLSTSSSVPPPQKVLKLFSANKASERGTNASSSGLLYTRYTESNNDTPENNNNNNNLTGGNVTAESKPRRVLKLVKSSERGVEIPPPKETFISVAIIKQENNEIEHKIQTGHKWESSAPSPTVSDSDEIYDLQCISFGEKAFSTTVLSLWRDLCGGFLYGVIMGSMDGKALADSGEPMLMATTPIKSVNKKEKNENEIESVQYSEHNHTIQQSTVIPTANPYSFGSYEYQYYHVRLKRCLEKRLGLMLASLMVFVQKWIGKRKKKNNSNFSVITTTGILKENCEKYCFYSDFLKAFDKNSYGGDSGKIGQAFICVYGRRSDKFHRLLLRNLCNILLLNSGLMATLSSPINIKTGGDINRNGCNKTEKDVLLLLYYIHTLGFSSVDLHTSIELLKSHLIKCLKIPTGRSSCQDVGLAVSSGMMTHPLTGRHLTPSLSNLIISAQRILMLLADRSILLSVTDDLWACDLGNGNPQQSLSKPFLTSFFQANEELLERQFGLPGSGGLFLFPVAETICPGYYGKNGTRHSSSSSNAAIKTTAAVKRRPMSISMLYDNLRGSIRPHPVMYLCDPAGARSYDDSNTFITTTDRISSVLDGNSYAESRGSFNTVPPSFNLREEKYMFSPADITNLEEFLTDASTIVSNSSSYHGSTHSITLLADSILNNKANFNSMKRLQMNGWGGDIKGVGVSGRTTHGNIYTTMMAVVMEPLSKLFREGTTMGNGDKQGATDADGKEDSSLFDVNKLMILMGILVTNKLPKTTVMGFVELGKDNLGAGALFQTLGGNKITIDDSYSDPLQEAISAIIENIQQKQGTMVTKLGTILSTESALELLFSVLSHQCRLSEDPISNIYNFMSLKKSSAGFCFQADECIQVLRTRLFCLPPTWLFTLAHNNSCVVGERRFSSGNVEWGEKKKRTNVVTEVQLVNGKSRSRGGFVDSRNGDDDLQKQHQRQPLPVSADEQAEPRRDSRPRERATTQQNENEKNQKKKTKKALHTKHDDQTMGVLINDQNRSLLEQNGIIKSLNDPELLFDEKELARKKIVVNWIECEDCQHWRIINNKTDIAFNSKRGKKRWTCHYDGRECTDEDDNAKEYVKELFFKHMMNEKFKREGVETKPIAKGAARQHPTSKRQGGDKNKKNGSQQQRDELLAKSGGMRILRLGKFSNVFPESNVIGNDDLKLPELALPLKSISKADDAPPARRRGHKPSTNILDDSTTATGNSPLTQDKSSRDRPSATTVADAPLRRPPIAAVVASIAGDEEDNLLLENSNSVSPPPHTAIRRGGRRAPPGFSKTKNIRDTSSSNRNSDSSSVSSSITSDTDDSDSDHEEGRPSTHHRKGQRRGSGKERKRRVQIRNEGIRERVQREMARVGVREANDEKDMSMLEEEIGKKKKKKEGLEDGKKKKNITQNKEESNDSIGFHDEDDDDDAGGKQDDTLRKNATKEISKAVSSISKRERDRVSTAIHNNLDRQPLPRKDKSKPIVSITEANLPISETYKKINQVLKELESLSPGFWQPAWHCLHHQDQNPSSKLVPRPAMKISEVDISISPNVELSMTHRANSIIARYLGMLREPDISQGLIKLRPSSAAYFYNYRHNHMGSVGGSNVTGATGGGDSTKNNSHLLCKMNVLLTKTQGERLVNFETSQRNLRMREAHKAEADPLSLEAAVDSIPLGLPKPPTSIKDQLNLYKKQRELLSKLQLLREQLGVKGYRPFEESAE